MNTESTRRANIMIALPFIFGTAVLALVIGSQKLSAHDKPAEQSASAINVYVDSETGCEYVVARDIATPRIASDGRAHMGCKGRSQ